MCKVTSAGESLCIWLYLEHMFDLADPMHLTRTFCPQGCHKLITVRFWPPFTASNCLILNPEPHRASSSHLSRQNTQAQRNSHTNNTQAQRKSSHKSNTQARRKNYLSLISSALPGAGGKHWHLYISLRGGQEAGRDLPRSGSIHLCCQGCAQVGGCWSNFCVVYWVERKNV